MNVVILAGGRGTRLEEETVVRPKPMVEIGGRPILWHIMKLYAHHGFKEFFLALGYKGEFIKRYFLHYHALNRDFSIDLASGEVVTRSDPEEDWKVHLLDTGLDTNTGGRVRRLEPLLGGETFMVTYGDGVSNVDIPALLAFHRRHGKLATLTAVRPPARFGEIALDQESVIEFREKPGIGSGWVNGGYLVFEPGIFEYLEGDATGLEVLGDVARDGQLAAYSHDGYWQCMDTLRDKRRLEEEWASGAPAWKLWD